MSGKAKSGIDFTLDGIAGQVVVPAGASSADVVMTALADGRSERSEKAAMSLAAGAGYTVSGTLNKATVTILNGATTTSGHHHR